jgi:hypothetical protein
MRFKSLLLCYFAFFRAVYVTELQITFGFYLFGFNGTGTVPVRYRTVRDLRILCPDVAARQSYI